MIPLSNWLSNVFGQRRYFIFSLVGFTGASVLCGLAPSLPLLVLARVLQGLLGGGLLPKAQAILFQTLPAAAQGIIQAAFGIVVLAGPALGPTLGGWLTDSLGWRWIFFINLPLGVLTVLLAFAFLEPDQEGPADAAKGPGGGRAAVDWFGILLLAAGLGSLQLVLEQGHQYDWLENSGIRQLTLVALIALPLFVVWELRQRAPAVDLRVLRYRSLAAGTLFSMALGMGLYGTVFIVPIFAQSQLGYTATQTGMLMLPGALASAMTMALLGRVVSRIDPRLLITVGGVLMVVTMLQLAAINPDTGEPSLYWPLIFRGSTTVLMFLPLSLASLGPLPRPLASERGGGGQWLVQPQPPAGGELRNCPAHGGAGSPAGGPSRPAGGASRQHQSPAAGAAAQSADLAQSASCGHRATGGAGSAPAQPAGGSPGHLVGLRRCVSHPGGGVSGGVAAGAAAGPSAIGRQGAALRAASSRRWLAAPLILTAARARSRGLSRLEP
jgi:EmrB/QacA subfamily drug resistance transporter